MGKRALITGGAGFIGSHLADELLAHGYEVRAIDSLSEQVHGPGNHRPGYLDPAVDLFVADIRDPHAVRGAIEGVDVVFHLAAMVGVGQSMYEIVRYTDVNNLGTAVLMEAMFQGQGRFERLVVASSMSIYGEGSYVSDDADDVPQERTRVQLEAGQWEVRNAAGHLLRPVPTPESKPPTLASVYALSKYDQERMCLMLGQAYRLPVVALRLFNVYGPRQALSNPYTGVLAIFASRLLNDRAPCIFEDGRQQRDFVSVHDVARAFRLAAEAPQAAGEALNIGSGRQYTVRQIADRVAAAVGKPHIAPEITGEYRVGDIRHCFADITRARQVLGYRPEVAFEDGLSELAQWLRGQVAEDRVTQAREELTRRGLTV